MKCLLVSLALLVLKAPTVVRDNLMFLVLILIYGASSGGRLVSSGFGETPQFVLTCTLKFSVMCSVFTTSFRWPGASIRGLSCCTGVAGI